MKKTRRASRIEILDLEPIPATQAKQRFGDLLHEASVNGQKFLVNRQGRPVAVVLSHREYCELVERARRGSGSDDKQEES